MKYTHLFIFFFLTFLSYSQTTNADNIFERFTKNVTANPDSAKIYLEKFDGLAKQKPELKQKNLYMKGLFAFYSEGRDKAEKLFDESLEIGEKTDPDLYYSVLRMKASVLRDRGEATECFMLLEKCMKYAKKSNDMEKVALLYNNMGTALLASRNERQAIPYFEKSLAYYKGKKPINMMNNYFLLAGAQKAIGDLSAAKKSLLGAQSIALEFNDILTLADLDRELGHLAILEGQYQKAVEHLLNADKIYSEVKFYEPLAVINLNLYEAYAGLKKWGDAKKCLDKAKEYIAINQEGDLKVHSQWMEYDYFKNVGDYQQALKIYEKYTAEKDSIYGLEKSKEISHLNVKFQTVEKDNEILTSKVKMAQKDMNLAKQKNVIYIVVACLAIFLILTVSLVLVWNKQRKLNTELQRFSEFDNLLYKIIGHDLRQSIYSVNHIEDKVGIEQATHNTLYILDGLLEWRNSNYEVNDHVSFEKLVDELEDEFRTELDYKKMKIVCRYNELPEIKGSGKGVQTILRNLYSNAIKYSLDNSTIFIDGNANMFTLENEVAANKQSGTEIGHTIIDVLSEKYSLDFKFNIKEEVAISTLIVVK